jgi:hypothetical protein
MIERPFATFISINCCSAYLFGQYHDAVKNGELAEKYLDSAFGVFGVTLINFFTSLSRLALFAQALLLKRLKSSVK